MKYKMIYKKYLYGLSIFIVSTKLSFSLIGIGGSQFLDNIAMSGYAKTHQQSSASTAINDTCPNTPPPGLASWQAIKFSAGGSNIPEYAGYDNMDIGYVELLNNHGLAWHLSAPPLYNTTHHIRTHVMKKSGVFFGKPMYVLFRDCHIYPAFNCCYTNQHYVQGTHDYYCTTCVTYDI